MKKLALNTAIRSSMQICCVSILATVLAACNGGDKNETGSSSSSSSSGSSSSSTSSSSTSSSSSSSSSSSGTACSGLFCDDFDGDSRLQVEWNDSGDVNVSSEQAYSGTNSVKIKAKGGSYNRNYMTLDMSEYPAAQKEVYGRMMMYLDSEGTNGKDFTFIQADGLPKNSSAPSDVNVNYRGRLDGGDDHFMSNYDSWNEAGSWTTDCWNHPETDDYSIPKNKWVCVEWHFDSVNDELDFWMDGKELTEIGVDGTGDGCVGQAENGIWKGPQEFTQLHLGIEQYHDGASPRTMFIDDVSVDTAKIGCP